MMELCMPDADWKKLLTAASIVHTEASAQRPTTSDGCSCHPCMAVIAYRKTWQTKQAHPASMHLKTNCMGHQYTLRFKQCLRRLSPQTGMSCIWQMEEHCMGLKFVCALASRLPDWHPSCNQRLLLLGNPMRLRPQKQMDPSRCPLALWILLMSLDWMAPMVCKPRPPAEPLLLPRILLLPGNLRHRQRGIFACNPI